MLGGAVQRFFTDTCVKHMDKYVPFGDTGLLKDVNTKTANSVTYEMPYAHYQYEGISRFSGKPLNYRTDKNPLASSHWDKKMVTAEIQDVVKEVQDYVRKHGNK